MFKMGFKAVLAMGVSFICFTLLPITALAMGKGAEAPRITKEELKAMLGNPDVVILDVRESEDWKKSRWKIQGAVREAPEKGIQLWAHKYSKDKLLVLY